MSYDLDSMWIHSYTSQSRIDFRSNVPYIIVIALRLKLVEENKVKSWLFVELTGFLFHLVDTHIAPIYEITWCNKNLLFINEIFLQQFDAIQSFLNNLTLNMCLCHVHLYQLVKKETIPHESVRTKLLFQVIGDIIEVILSVTDDIPISSQTFEMISSVLKSAG